MSELLKLESNEQMENVKRFLTQYKKKLKPNQLQLIKHFIKYIPNFTMTSIQIQDRFDSVIGTHTAVFEFHQFGVKGEIKIHF